MAEHIYFCSRGASDDWFLVWSTHLIRFVNCRLLWTSESFSRRFATISIRDEFFSSFDFFPPNDWGHLLQGDRTHRCCDGASNGILVLEGKSNVILQIVSSFWMHTFRRLNCHVPQSIIWLSCCHFAPIMLWGLKHFLRVLSSCKWPAKEFGNFFYSVSFKSYLNCMNDAVSIRESKFCSPNYCFLSHCRLMQQICRTKLEIIQAIAGNYLPHR